MSNQAVLVSNYISLYKIAFFLAFSTCFDAKIKILTKNILTFHDTDTSITYDWEISHISDQDFVITRDTFVDGQTRNLIETYSH